MRIIARYILISAFVILISQNSKGQITEFCGTDTVILSLDNYSAGAIQWQESYDGISWKNIPNQNNLTYRFYTNEDRYCRALIITSSCEEVYSGVAHITQKALSDAGNDQTVSGIRTQLSANTRQGSTGKWKTVTGTGGIFSDPTAPDAVFEGIINTEYVLVWSLTNTCGTSSDTVRIIFMQNHYQSNYIVVDTTDIILSSAQEIKDGIYHIRFSESVAGINDSIMLIGIGGEGFLRKVTSFVYEGSNTYLFQTEQGLLDDLCIDGIFNLGDNVYGSSSGGKNDITMLNGLPTRKALQNNLPWNNKVFLYLKPGRTESVAGIADGSKGSSSTNISLQFDNAQTGWTLDNPGKYFFAAHIVLDGTYSFVPNYLFDILIKNKKLKFLRIDLNNAVISKDMKSVLITSVTGFIPESDKPVAQKSLYRNTAVGILIIGGVPVVVTTETELMLNATVSGTGISSVGATDKTIKTFSSGLKYEPDSTTTHEEYQVSGSFIAGVSVTGAMDIHIDLSPGVRSKLYGVEGPFFKVSENTDAALCGITSGNNNLWDARIVTAMQAEMGSVITLTRQVTQTLSSSVQIGEPKTIYIPDNLSLLAGNNQSAASGERLQQTFRVLVTDNDGNPVPDVMVTFDVVIGNGIVESPVVLTDDLGIAQTYFSLGTVSKENEVTASVIGCESSDIAGSPVTFYATSTSFGNIADCANSSLAIGFKLNPDSTVEPYGMLGQAPYTYSTDGMTFFASPPLVPFETAYGSVFFARDNNGCEVSKQWLPEDPCLSSDLNINVTANGKNIVLSASGGKRPYLYAVDSQVDFSSITLYENLNTGGHLAFVKDSLGCIRSVSFNIGDDQGGGSLPILTTNDITSRTDTSATLSGSVFISGSGAVGETGFCWGISPDPTINDGRRSAGSGAGGISTLVTGLSPNTQYFVRVYAITDQGIAYGNQVTFTTLLGPLKGLVAYYPLNGNANDESGNGNNGIVYGATLTTDRFGNPGRAYMFNGTISTYIEIPQNAAIEPQNSISISFWSKKLGTGTENEAILRKASNCAAGYIVWGKGYAYINGPDCCSGQSTAVVFNPNMNNWDFNTVVYDYSSNLKFYQNGILKDTSSSLHQLMSHTGNLYIGGAIVHPQDGGFNGVLDDIRIYNRALSQAEIDTLYHEGGYPGENVQLTDIDGNIYNTVRIGDQVWMKENLKTTRFNDGTEIHHLYRDDEWSNHPLYAYCWYNNDETSNKNDYGALYNWLSTSTGKLCPAGWHVPTDAEWQTLETFAGMPPGQVDSVGWRGTEEANLLKEAGPSHWGTINSAATNSTGFTALPGGLRYIFGNYDLNGSHGYWWTSTGNTNSDAIGRFMNNSSGLIYRGNLGHFNIAGASVRCIKGAADPAALPFVSFILTSGITQNTAEITGNLANEGGTPVLERGVCWSTSHNPTINDRKASNGTGTGVYFCRLDGLKAGTVYYCRLYATNSNGTGYSNEISFTTLAFNLPPPGFNSELAYGTVTDVEGNIYKTIQIGTQIWMAENLRTTKYSDGSQIPIVYGYEEWMNMQSPALCWYQNDSVSFRNIFGALYNWYTIDDNTKLCPSGWHVPTYWEYDNLNRYLGGMSASGKKLKEAGTSHWNSPNPGANNETGFTALPTGMRYGSWFSPMGYYNFFWASTPTNTNQDPTQVLGWRFQMDWNSEGFFSNTGGRTEGYSIRCIKDTLLNIYFPRITTSQAYEISQASARIDHDIVNDGGAVITARGICWDSSHNPTVNDNKIIESTLNGSVSTTLTGLEPNTIYYVRAFAKNSYGFGYGDQVIFRTSQSAGLPAVITKSVSNLIDTAATVTIRTEADGGSPILQQGVCWSSVHTPSISDTLEMTGSGTGESSAIIRGLRHGRTYYVRAFSTNSNGTSYGVILKFTSSVGFSVGQEYGGGIIFYIDGTGQHGLICSSQDLGLVEWGCSGSGVSGALGTSIGSGYQNTVDILNGCVQPQIAARLCYELVLEGYNDWYLPAEEEIELIYSNLHLQGLGNFSTNAYWSSSQDGRGNVLAYHFSGTHYWLQPLNTLFFLRAVRAF